MEDFIRIDDTETMVEILQSCGYFVIDEEQLDEVNYELLKKVSEYLKIKRGSRNEAKVR